MNNTITVSPKHAIIELFTLRLQLEFCIKEYEPDWDRYEGYLCELEQLISRHMDG